MRNVLLPVLGQDMIKPVFEGICSNLCKGYRGETERNIEKIQRDSFQAGYYLGTFWLSEVHLTFIMVGGSGNREKRGKIKFNGRTNMGLLENGLEIGFFKL